MLFFFLLTPRPPSSTLFPYTTLFRSGGHGLGECRGGQLTGPGDVHVRDHRGGPERDRKSTRLNSSHVAISYAVFCLKKKKKKKHKRLQNIKTEKRQDRDTM